MFSWAFRKIVALINWLRGGSPRLVMVVSTQEQEVLPPSTDSCLITDQSGPEVEYQCGHRHHERFIINIFGEPIELTDEAYAKRERCAQCRLTLIKECVIRCAQCGFGIRPGEAVALYTAESVNSAWATYVGERAKLVIGCMRWDCCPSGGFFAGHWTGKHFQAAFEGGGTAAAEVFRTGEAVFTTVGGPKEK
ncbi:MAG: hypothetical protein KBC69_03765 [Candidatus Magasanikbacteria bacterium]|nr:hypothetical protein [Candidatus Magasanikbacteria bacterium]